MALLSSPGREGRTEASMASLRLTVFCISTLATLIPITAPAAAKGQFGPGQMACKVVRVPTPADPRPSPYTHRLFDGSVQAWVPPVPPGYRGKVVMVPTEVCH
jgi:hypothetical protein